VLVIPSWRQTRLQSAIYDIRTLAKETTRKVAVASHSTIAVSGIGFLEEGVRWCAGKRNNGHRRNIAFGVGHLRTTAERRELRRFTFYWQNKRLQARSSIHEQRKLLLKLSDGREHKSRHREKLAVRPNYIFV